MRNLRLLLGSFSSIIDIVRPRVIPCGETSSKPVVNCIRCAVFFHPAVFSLQRHPSISVLPENTDRPLIWLSIGEYSLSHRREACVKMNGHMTGHIRWWINEVISVYIYIYIEVHTHARRVRLTERSQVFSWIVLIRNDERRLAC